MSTPRPNLPRLKGWYKDSGIFYTAGLLIVGAWTLLRFFSVASTYDLVTQQLVARSWLHGNFGSISFGTTNYIFKLIFLYIPADLLPGSPRAKLIGLTLLINFATFVLIYKLLEKILAQFGIHARNYLRITMLWLAAIAGSVFWIQYANSRNLEVAGGLLLIYLSLRFLKKPTWRLAAGMSLFAACLFFDDNLQFYMAALPVLLYGIIFCARKWRVPAYLALVLGAGFLGSQLLFWLSSKLLHIDFTASNSFVHHQSLAQIVRAVPTAAKTTLTLFAGTVNPRHLREALNLFFLFSGLLLFIWVGIRRAVPRRLLALVAIYYACNEAVYIISGQATTGNNARYLIMLAPITILAIASLGKVLSKNYLAYVGACLLILANVLAIGSDLSADWRIKPPKDEHLLSLARYAKQTNSSVIYASMDTALPLSYYQYAPKTKFVALACAQPRLQLARSVPPISLPSQADTAIILDGKSINNVPSVCNETAIANQLGQPTAVRQLDDGSEVLIYPAAVLGSLN